MLKRLRQGLQRLLSGWGQRHAAAMGKVRSPVDSGSPWLQRGLALIAKRNFTALEHELEQHSSTADPAEWSHLAGITALARGDGAAAIDHLRRAVALRADFSMAHNALGEALQRAGRHQDALASFKRAVELKHDYVEAIVNQGGACRALGQLEDAIDSYETALAFMPDYGPALLALGRLRRKAADSDSALRLLERGAQLAPHNAEFRFELGLVRNRRGDTQMALADYEHALELAPDHVGACVNAGLIQLVQLGNAPRARQYFERALALQPDSVAAQANLGLALQEEGDFQGALAHYDRLIAAYPEVAEYRWNRGIALLAAGDFARGWEDYELRNSRAGRTGARSFPLPAWDGSMLARRHILIFGEQGIGDEIMFASCVPDVLQQAQSVVVECDVRLQALFRRSFPAAHVHGAPRDGNREWLAAFPELDTQIAAASLPRYLRRERADFPRHHGYLTADPVRRGIWQQRLAALGGGFKVGICWRGGTLKTRGELRSLAPEQCLPLLKTPNCRFICLNSGDCSAEVAFARQHGALLQWWPEAMRDFDEMAALFMALDLVIAVPCSAVHLAGALGRPLWVMLSASPEWRYLWQGERMPWYPSARLMRQRCSGEWQPLIEQVAVRLAAAARAGVAD